MAKFKVGDKVRILDGSKIEDYTGSWAIFGGMNKYIGTIQTIEEVDEDWSDGRVSYYMEDIGYSWDERGLELVTEQKQPKIVITTDGKTTTATLYDGKQKIKSAKAKCAPGDTFDFNIGASIALERLTGFVRGSTDNTLDTRLQMDKFMAGDIVIEVPDGKTMDFLKELEKKNEKLRWHAGQKPTEWGHRYKYFRIHKGSLGYIDKCDLHMVPQPVEIWDDVESTSDVPHAIRAIAAFEALMKLMKDEFDD